MLRYLRLIALSITLVGAAVSLLYTLQGGSENPSTLLVVLFIIWVLSPFIALFIAFWLSDKWRTFDQVMVSLIMVILAIGAMLGYSGMISPENTRPAFMFLLVPLVSWLLIVGLIIVPLRFSRKRLQKENKD